MLGGTRGPRLDRASLWREIVRHKFFYVMLLPVVVWFIIFCYIPMYGVLAAFQNYVMSRGIFGSEWVGLKHFEKLWADKLFWRAFKNSCILASYRVLIEFPIPIIMAVLINEMRRSSTRKIAQTVLFLPHFLSWITVASILITFINPDKGLVTAIAKGLFGVAVPPNLITNGTFRGLLVVSNLWKEAGWGMIIYLAAMSGVDANLYEAAWVDGANRFRRTWHITLPSVRGVIAISLILMIGGVLNTGFDQVFVLSNKLVMETADTIDYYVYRIVMTNFDMSYAAAIGLFNSLICIVLMLTANALGRALDSSSIF